MTARGSFQMRFCSLMLLGFYALNFSCFQAQAENKTTELIPQFLNKLSPKNQAQLKKVNGYFEIRFIQIDRDEHGTPSFIEHTHSGRKNAYFNPASLVKLPTVLMTLEKLETLGIDKFSRYQTKNESRCSNQREPEEKSLEGYDNLANQMRKILLVSDNVAYNILFDFLGQDYISQQLRNKKYNNAYIIRRFADCSLQDNMVSNPFWFFDKSNQLIYEQKSQVNTKPIPLPIHDVLVGKAHKDGNKLVQKPKNFKTSNHLVLADVVSMMQALIFPEATDEHRRWHISQDNRNFVLKYLAMLPRESNYVDYQNPKNFDDTYKKLLIFGDQKHIQPEYYQNLKSINMIGFSFGFISDVAYIVDFENNVEFFLAISMYANDNDIIDGAYNYHDIARPFFAEFGRIVLEHERKRTKKNTIDLSNLKNVISQ